MHPKSRDMDKTKSAWAEAVRSGVDPKKITAAAQAYAREMAGQDFQFIKQSAGWIRDRRYEDKFAPEPEPNGRPQLRAVAGGWQPFQNPENQDVYDEPLI